MQTNRSWENSLQLMNMWNRATRFVKLKRDSGDSSSFKFKNNFVKVSLLIYFFREKINSAFFYLFENNVTGVIYENIAY